VLSAVAATACGDDDALVAPAPAPVALASHSATPALVKNVLAGVDVYSLLSSEDVLAASPNWVFGGSADGSGLMRNADGSYTLLVNNEDNYSVSRVRLDSTFKPVRGDYLMNSDGGRWRLCSATLAAPAVHGFGPLSFTADETDRESQIHAVNPEGSLNSSTIVTAFGRWNAEQALPLPAAAYAVGRHHPPSDLLHSRRRDEKLAADHHGRITAPARPHRARIHARTSWASPCLSRSGPRPLATRASPPAVRAPSPRHGPPSGRRCRRTPMHARLPRPRRARRPSSPRSSSRLRR
jgi:hypothetical protein